MSYKKGIYLLIVMLSVTGCGKMDNDISRQEMVSSVETAGEILTDINSGETQINNTLLPTPASWSLNTMIDTEFADIIYADDERVIFYAYFGLFEYDLTEKKLINSLDLKAINCQKVQCGGRSEIYADTQGKEVWIKPYNRNMWYVFQPQENTLREELTAEGVELFKQVAFKDTTTIEDILQQKIRFCSNHVVTFSDGTYGYIMTRGPEVTQIEYCRGEQNWPLFTEDQPHEDDLLKQDDSFYMDYREYANRSFMNFFSCYSTFYELGDYAALCALSKNVSYSDEEQRKWAEQKRDVQMQIEQDEQGEPYQIVFEEDNEIKKVDIVQEDGIWKADGLPHT